MNFVKLEFENNKKNSFLTCISLMTGISYEWTEEDYLNFLKREKIKNVTEKTIIKRFASIFFVEEIKFTKKVKLKDLDLDDGKYIVFCKDRIDFDHAVYIENKTIYAKYKNLLNINVSKIYKQNELLLYKRWMDNRSFFGNNLFVLKELTSLSKLGQITEKKFIGIMDKPELESRHVSNRETIKLVQSYFKKHNININVSKMIKNKDLILAKEEKKSSKALYGTRITDGNNWFDKDEQKVKSKVYIDNTLYDSIIMVHELTHYRNHPIDSNRNLINDILTESLSYANELIFASDFKNKDDKEFFKNYYTKTLFLTAYDLYYIYKIIKVYKSKDSLEKEKYLEYYKKDDYDKALNDFKKFADSKQSIFERSYHLLGRCLGIYMFVEYKKNNLFFEKIEKLNNSISDLDIIECLNIIDIKDFKDLVKKYELACNKLIEVKGDVDAIY